jgi:hypothetical protein
MNVRRIVMAILFVIVTIAGLGVQPTLAQTTDQATPAAKKEEETNLDTQLYLIVGHNQEVEETKLPAALEPVLKQLRASLPFRNYRVSVTLINRVKNDGRLNLKWIGGPLIVSGAATNQTPSFNEFKVNNVRLFKNEAGQTFVRLDGFGFGARLPIQSGTAIASTGPAPPIMYEHTGLNTDISMREGEPVIVGTLNVGPSGDAIILVVSAKRATK